MNKIEQQDQEILKITLLKFLGSEQDKREFLRSRGWSPRYGHNVWDHPSVEKSSFYTEWRKLDEVFDCEVRFILTGHPGYGG